MKRSQQSVPSVETGAVAGDYSRSQSIQWKNRGGRNATTEDGKHGSGLAPKPSGGAPIKGNDRPSAPSQAGLARVKQVGGAPKAGNFLPVRNNANAGLAGSKIGQPNPQTGAAATAKPKRRGLGASFYGEY